MGGGGRGIVAGEGWYWCGPGGWRASPPRRTPAEAAALSAATKPQRSKTHTESCGEARRTARPSATGGHRALRATGGAVSGCRGESKLLREGDTFGYEIRKQLGGHWAGPVVAENDGRVPRMWGNSVRY